MLFEKITKKVIEGGEITLEEAKSLLESPVENLPEIIFMASRIRRHCKKNRMAVCAIVNGKSGKCSENCAFCAQSAHFSTTAKTYSVLTPDELVEAAREEREWCRRFSIVTSGRGADKEILESCEEAVKRIESETKLLPCASLGILSKEEFLRLRKAGLRRYHHNLETSRNFFPSICSTHTYEERVKTIRDAKDAGLEVCVGGIFGLGESTEDRISFLFEIKEVDPVAVPINFLTPIEGTPLGDRSTISPFEAAKIIALARCIMPEKDIKVAGGRLDVFKDTPSLPFLAGANGMITGNLLTTRGRTPEMDLELLSSLGFEISE